VDINPISKFTPPNLPFERGGIKRNMKKSELFFSALLVPMDYVALFLAALLAYQIRYMRSVTDIRPVIFNLDLQSYIVLVLVVGLLWIFIFAIAGLYNIKGTRAFYEEAGRVFLSSSAGIALVMAAMFFTRYLFDSRFIILTSWILSILFVLFERAIVRNIQRAFYKKGVGVHRVILIGNGEIAKNLASEFINKPRLGYSVVKDFPEFQDDIKSELRELAKNDKYDEIIQTNANIPREKMLELVDLAQECHVDFKYVADLLGTKVSHFQMRAYGEVPVIELKRTPLDGWGRILKRIFDIIFSAFFLATVSPIVVASAIAIKMDSEGPIFFQYKRIGEKGRVIDFLKFRTMIKDAHKLRYNKEFMEQHKNLREGTPMIKFENDPRITRVGKFLRRWSIDELPQLFLVLIGRMSLVGPRPHEIEEVGAYNKTQKKVLTIKPGITGLAQVSGRSDLNFDEEVKLDNFYIENWSLMMDIRVLLKTPAAVFKGRSTL